MTLPPKYQYPNIGQDITKLIVHRLYALLHGVSWFQLLLWGWDANFNIRYIDYILVRCRSLLRFLMTTCASYPNKIKHTSAKQLLRAMKADETETSKTIKVSHIRNTFHLRKNIKQTDLNRLDEQNKRIICQYQSIQLQDNQRTGREYVASRSNSKNISISQGVKEPIKFRRYRSIEQETGESSNFQGRSCDALKYLPKKGRILLNMNSSRNKLISSLGEENNKCRERTKLASISIALREHNDKNDENTCVRMNTFQSIQEPLGNEVSRASAAKKANALKSKSRRFLTEASEASNKKINQPMAIKDTECNKQRTSMKANNSLKVKIKTQPSKEIYHIIQKQCSSIFEQYLQRMKADWKQDGTRRKNKEKDWVKALSRQASKEASKETSPRNQQKIQKQQGQAALTQVSSIMEIQESSFLSVEGGDMLKDLFKKKQTQRASKNSQHQQAQKKLFQDDIQDQMVSSQDSSLNAQTKSKKNILRSIDKIKKAFPKGFFNGL